MVSPVPSPPRAAVSCKSKKYHWMFRFAVLILSAAVSQKVVVSGEVLTPVLKQVHVITRHGARTTLPKNVDTLLDAAGSTLTPLGHKQLYDLGVWLRTNYYERPLASQSSSSPNPYAEYRESLQFYNPAWHHFESSSLDRTLSSATALSKGLFPKQTYEASFVDSNTGSTEFNTIDNNFGLPEGLLPSIPIYSQPEKHDITLRTFRNCPTFHQRLQTLFASQPWTTMESNHQSLLQKLSEKFPDYISDSSSNILALKDIWNVYDAIHVARTECASYPTETTNTCESIDNYQYLLESLNDSEFQELEELMITSERLKFGVGTAGNLLGSNLLWQILSRFDVGTFYMYSAHGPTILGFLSTLKEISYFSTLERHVEYGSSVIVEVYQDIVNDIYVRFLYKSSNSQEAKYLELDHIQCNQQSGNTTYCKITDFLNWAVPNTILTQEDWCLQCQNDFSDVCMTQLMSGKSPIKLGISNIQNALAEDFRGNDSMAIAITFFGGLLTGFVIWGIGMIVSNRVWKNRRYSLRRNRSRRGENSDANTTINDFAVIGGGGSDKNEQTAPTDRQDADNDEESNENMPSRGELS